jgi:hypothetical protein
MTVPAIHLRRLSCSDGDPTSCLSLPFVGFEIPVLRASPEHVSRLSLFEAARHLQSH